MTDTIDPMQDRPLVTFALFAYNQEQYIREAVEGAFSQTYEPLEIILSDDFSSDRTFEIMQEMAREYRGPHIVKVRQSSRNRRLAGHINEVSATASGKIIVLAAGDDISLPERTNAHAAVYAQWPSTFAVCSNYFVMTAPVIALPQQTERGIREFTLVQHLSNVGGWGLGATYSYRKRCFDWPQKIPESIETEDRVLPTRAAVLGRVSYLNAKLVRYRTPQEMGELEGKRRWWREDAVNQRAIHLQEILDQAERMGLISKLSKAVYLMTLRLAVQKAILKNSPDLASIQPLFLWFFLVFCKERINPVNDRFGTHRSCSCDITVFRNNFSNGTVLILFSFLKVFCDCVS